jgi:hypothetical protein
MYTCILRPTILKVVGFFFQNYSNSVIIFVCYCTISCNNTLLLLRVHTSILPQLKCPLIFAGFTWRYNTDTVITVFLSFYSGFCVTLIISLYTDRVISVLVSYYSDFCATLIVSLQFTFLLFYDASFIVFGLTQLLLEPTMYNIQGKHDNHYTTDGG